MSVNTVTAGVNGFNPSVIGGTGGTTKIFPALNYPNNGLNTASGTSILNGSQVAGQTPCTCSIPANGQYEGERFVVTCGGRIFIHGSSPTMNWFMYNGTSMTASSDGTALVTTASALSGLTTNKAYPWTWQTVFQGDSTSGILQAVSSALWVDNATGGTITLTGATGINFLAGGPTGLIGPGYTGSSGSSTAALNLIIGIQFTVSDALNAGYLNQFTVES